MAAFADCQNTKVEFKMIPWLFKWDVGKSREQKKQRERSFVLDILSGTCVGRSSSQSNCGSEIQGAEGARLMVVEIHKEKVARAVVVDGIARKQ